MLNVALKKLIILIILMHCFSLWAEDGFTDVFGENPQEDEAPGFSYKLSGEVGMGMDFYMDNGWDSEIKAYPYVLLFLEAGNEAIESKAAFAFSMEDFELQLKADDMIEELYLKTYFPFGYLEGGYIKTEWGKGDGDHVIDPLNPLDNSKGIHLDLNKMKSSEILARFGFYLWEFGLLELVYKPFFTPMEFDYTGRWKVFDRSILPGHENIVLPDTHTLRYGQAATRATFTAGALDLGLMYYYGFMTETGYKITSTLTGADPGNPAHYTPQANIAYTRAHLFGMEAAWALGLFTMRAELGYWLTEDLNGNAAELYNNRLVYLGGLDFTIPKINLFLSAQLKGSYVFHFDGLAISDADMMASFSDTAYSNTILSTVELPFLQDKMKLRLSGLLQIETVGYMVAFSYYWTILDDLELSVSTKIFGGSNDSAYQRWDKNDSISMAMKYFF